MGATRTRRNSSSNGSNSGSTGRAKQQQRQQWEGDPDFAQAFHREENEGNQPRYTGQGIISLETLRAIAAADGECQVAVWPRRAKSGKRYLSIHVEPPYEGGSEEDEVDFDADAESGADDDLPF